MRRRSFLRTALGLWPTWRLSAPAWAQFPPSRKPDASDEFFSRGVIPELRIRVGEEQVKQLKANPREFVDCSFTENGGTVFSKVKIKLKGAAGSFRNFDDRPALTLSLKKKGERFHGMDKFHLNNSVQDDSYLSELLGAELYRQAGHPASRVTHARVWLNDRDVGFYVLKEGFDKTFLARHFEKPTGNLYDGGFCRDFDQPLEKDEGEGPDDHSDLKALVEACRDGDPVKRRRRVAELLDVEAFITFAALELMTCHWDGYCQNRNNYRIYIRAEDRKAMFLPHGMDQLFGDTNFSVHHVPGAMAASAVLNDPEWRARYQQRVRELLPLFDPLKLHAQIDAAHARMRPVLVRLSADRAKQFDERAKGMKDRVAGRRGAILTQSPPVPLAFNAQGWAPLTNWEPRNDGDAKLEKRVFDGRAGLVVETGPSGRCAASFRTKVLLAKGSYRLEASAKPQGIKPLTDEKGTGAGLRLSGVNRQNQLSGDGGWQPLAYPFDVPEELKNVEVVAELRSTAGGVAFDVASLRIVRVK